MGYAVAGVLWLGLIGCLVVINHLITLLRDSYDRQLEMMQKHGAEMLELKHEHLMTLRELTLEPLPNDDTPRPAQGERPAKADNGTEPPYESPYSYPDWTDEEFPDPSPHDPSRRTALIQPGTDLSTLIAGMEIGGASVDLGAEKVDFEHER